MIKTLEKSGRTEEEAINAAVAELGLDRDDVSVEILQRAKSGFLGIGACPARIQVSYEVPDEPIKKAPVPEMKKASAEAEKPAETKKAPAEAKKPTETKKAPAEAKKPTETKKAPDRAPEAAAPAAAVADDTDEAAEIRRFLSGLLERMGVEADIDIRARGNDGMDVNLTGAGMGAIIGRRGETLDAIQHLTNYVVNHGSDKRMHISVDAESYRSKREDSLVKLAEKMAEKAIKYKRSMALEPMNSYERHVIHTALQNYEGVTTCSTGEEPNRRVVVSYVKPETPSSKPKSREWA